MTTYLDCIPCFLQQALRAGRAATNDEKQIKLLLDEVGGMIRDIPMLATPPETGDMIYRKVSQITGVADPYFETKKSSIKEALALYPKLKAKIEQSSDKLLTAIKLAIAGNIIDLGVGIKYNLSHDIETILHQEIAISHYATFTTELQKARNILYLGDNAGESVFDRLLIEQLNRPVTYVVRNKAVINDVTFDDAIDSGLDKVAKIISSGSSAPGTILSRCSPAFRAYHNKADMIISKGQGNYEGLSETKRPVFFLLKAKCPVIARNLKVKKGDIILKSINLETLHE